MTFQKSSIIALLAFPIVVACVGEWKSEEPGVATIDDARLIVAELPEITLVQRVIPEKTMKRVGGVGGTYEETATTSKFGSPREIANFDCVVDGLKAVLPGIRIIPTESFWEKVAQPREEVTLSELFEPPISTPWHDFGVEFLIVAYHKESEVSEAFKTLLFMSLYEHTINEVAAEVTIDVPNKTTISASRAAAKEGGVTGHVTVYPVVIQQRASSDPCEVVAEISATAISNQISLPSPRVIIIAAKTNPYDAALAITRKMRQESYRYPVEPEARHLVRAYMW